jgi:hypothetical protein
MESWDLKTERNRLAAAINSCKLDFSAAYMSVQKLHALVQTHPHVAGEETIYTLKQVLEGPQYTSQTQSFFLYREAAEALASFLLPGFGQPLSELAGVTLKEIIRTATGTPKRAAAEALGALPVGIRGPQLDKEIPEDIPALKWADLLCVLKISLSNNPTFLGRSLVAEIKNSDEIFVVKLVCSGGSFEAVYREALWMKYFSEFRSNRYQGF